MERLRRSAESLSSCGKRIILKLDCGEKEVENQVILSGQPWILGGICLYRAVEYNGTL